MVLVYRTRMSFVLVVVTVACLAALLQIPLAEAASTDVFHTYGNKYNEEYAEAMIEHSFDNNIVMAGTMNVNVSGVSEDDFFLMKVTPEGVELWTKVKFISMNMTAMSRVSMCAVLLECV